MAQIGSKGGNLFANGGVSTLRLLAYLAMSVILMVADHRGGYLEQLRASTGLITGPLYRLAGAPARLARGVSGYVIEQQQLIEENHQLRQDVLLANARLDRLAGVYAENSRLRELLGGTHGLRLAVQLVSLADVDLDPFRHRLILDAGHDQGVREGMAVIDARGVMGQVLEVAPSHSTVILISDPSHAIPVQVMRTGLRAIAFGTGRVDALEVPSIPLSADLKPGDVLETSGIGGRFPAGFKVGTIVSLQPDDTRLFVVAKVKPSASLDRGGEVLLVSNDASAAEASTMGPPVPPDWQPPSAPEVEP
ncbi:MAG TPA: rod shape-determining protein MreC [Chiayiivirga sp.]|nr:rod shape-determining protein MreC [Chiayiivirga sp.]